MVDLSYTIVIQCINFGILLWLLKKVLFTPVMDLLQKRTADVKKLKDDAEKEHREAQRRVAEAGSRKTEARKESLDMIAASRQEGFRQKKKILERAKLESEGIIRSARSEMDREVENAKDGLRKSTVEISVRIAEKLVKRSLEGEDQEKYAERFLQEMERKV